jgi:hypothetical protein
MAHGLSTGAADRYGPRLYRAGRGRGGSALRWLERAWEISGKLEIDQMAASSSAREFSTEAVMLRKDIPGFDQPIVFVPRDSNPATLVLKPTKEEAFFFGEFGHLLLRESF